LFFFGYTARAKEEIMYAYTNALPHYGVQASSFDEIWKMYKDQIETYGLGHYSKTILFEAEKSLAREIN